MANRLKAPFVTKKEVVERNKTINPYGKNFVEKIEASGKSFKEGKCKIIETQDLGK